jgi:ABC-type Fe3+ transport system permease subunit
VTKKTALAHEAERAVRENGVADVAPYLIGRRRSARSRSWQPAPALGPGLMLGIILAVSLVIVSELGVVIWLSVVDGAPGLKASISFEHYGRVFSDSLTYRALFNTIGFSFSTLVVSLVFGVPIAWLVERTDLLGKPIVFTMMTLGLVIPGFTSAGCSCSTLRSG